MMPTDIPAPILALHAEYERLVGVKITLNWFRIDCWRVFIGYRKHAPFTIQDLRAVVEYFKRTRKGGLLDNSLRFSVFIQQPDRFEEDLNLCRQALRPRPPATKQIVACGSARIVRDENTGDTIRHAGGLSAAMIATLRAEVDKAKP
jgi:hypothetical protein